MAVNQHVRPKRIRFSVRTLLVLVFFVAMMLWGSREAYERRNSISLAVIVSEFNAQAQKSEVGRYEPPLTESEVVAAIKAQLPLADAAPQVNAIYRRIAATGRAPIGTRFDDIPCATDQNGTQVVWWIRLSIPLAENSGYALAIRDTNDPAIVKARRTARITNVDILEARERYQNGRHELN